MEDNHLYDTLLCAIADKMLAEIRIQECLHAECAHGALRRVLKKKLESCGLDIDQRTQVSEYAPINIGSAQHPKEPKNTTLKCTKYATKPLKSDEGYFFKEKQLKDEASSGEFYVINIYDDDTYEISLRTTGIDRNTLRDSDEIMPSEMVTKSGNITAECQIVVERPARGELRDKRIFIVGQMKVAFTE